MQQVAIARVPACGCGRSLTHHMRTTERAVGGSRATVACVARKHKRVTQGGEARLQAAHKCRRCVGGNTVAKVVEAGKLPCAFSWGSHSPLETLSGGDGHPRRSAFLQCMWQRWMCGRRASTLLHKAAERGGVSPACQ